MAVDASHVTLFSPPNMEMIYQGNGTMYDDQLPAFGSKPEKLLPAYDFGKADAFPVPISRKRSRDSSSFNPVPFFVQNVNPDEHRYGEFTFLGGDISLQIYQQQSEIDRLISHHTEKVRSEIEQIRKRNNQRLISAIHEGITKRLQQKEEQYLKIGRLNWSLEEKVKSLSMENQILKELVQTNEATANALRNKLQQVLAQVQLQQQQQHIDYGANAGNATVLFDDAQSQCGSNYDEDNNNRNRQGERKVTDENDDGKVSRTASSRWCRKCEKEESCVLLLPCRHLCVCTLCVSSISFCPVCKATKSAGVVVNMSSS